MKYRYEMLLFHEEKLFFLCHRARAVRFCRVFQGMRVLRHEGKRCFMSGEGDWITDDQWMGLNLNRRSLPLFVIIYLREGCFLPTHIPRSSVFPLHPGEDRSSGIVWGYALVPWEHPHQFNLLSLSWRLGCVFFVQTLFLNSEAEHNVAFVGFFFFLELPFVYIGREIALLLRISKPVLLLQPWSCCYIKEREKKPLNIERISKVKRSEFMTDCRVICV